MIASADLLARCSFPPAGSSVCCAVSGGPDSVAMLFLAVEAGLEVEIVHVDHGLRPDSSDDADVVGRNAERMGCKLVVAHVEVEPGANLEERARIARHGALPEGALLGHTADDQAETVMLNLLRGSGLHGIAGMRTDERRRPIIGLRRSETRELCISLDLEMVDDPTNLDPAIRRNRVRHELMPLLDSIAERDVVPLLCRLADVARESVDHLDAESGSIDCTDVGALRESEPLLARLALREWLRSVDVLGHPPDRATVDRVMAVATLDLGATDVGGGWRVRRSSGRLRLERIDT